jgi:hypothetical protein
MKKLIIIGFYPLFLYLLAFNFLVSKINAQTAPNYDVTVSPVFFDLSSNPGGVVTDKIRIRNNGSSPLPIKLTIKRLTGDAKR